MLNLVKNEDDLENLEEIADSQSKVKRVRLEQKLGKQGFHYDKIELFEPNTKAFEDKSEKLLEESKSTTKALEEMNESNVHVKDLELMKKNGKIDTSLSRPLATLLVQNKSHFRLYDDLDSDNWNDYRKNGKKLQNMTIS